MSESKKKMQSEKISEFENEKETQKTKLFLSLKIINSDDDVLGKTKRNETGI